MKKLLLAFGALAFAVSSNFGWSQLYFQEDFENGLTAWTSEDADGDGANWQIANFGDGQGQVAISQSWNSSVGPLTPNNYLISPQISLGTTGLELTFKVKGQDPDFSAEHYAVYVTTSNTVADITAATPVLEETLPGATVNYLTRTIDLSAYSGQDVYITFRHFDITNMFYINIDDVVVGDFDDVEMVGVTNDSYIQPSNISITGTVKNNGTSNITDLDITYDVGSGPVLTSLSGLSIAPGTTYNFTCSTPLAMQSGDFYNVQVCASIANDIDNTNDCMDKPIAVVSQLVDKYVVVEEKTGTWCGWCPYGTVALDELHENQPMAIEIAIHNQDPMVLSVYDNESASTFPDFTGYPYAAADRVVGDHAANAANSVNARLGFIAPASVSFVEAVQAGNTITITPKVDMVATVNGDFGLAVVITEDSVTGSGSGWAQHNYFEGTTSLVATNGVDWKDLPEWVDQSEVFGGYNHVARALGNNEYEGDAGSLPSTLTNGQSYTYTYTFNYDPKWGSLSNLHAVAMLIDRTTGAILNAKKTKIVGTASIVENEMVSNFNVYPNPTSNMVNVDFRLSVDSETTINVCNAAGQVVLTKHLGLVSGAQNVIMNISSLAEGFYIIKVKTDNSVQTQRLSIVK